MSTDERFNHWTARDKYGHFYTLLRMLDSDRDILSFDDVNAWLDFYIAMFGPDHYQKALETIDNKRTHDKYNYALSVRLWIRNMHSKKHRK